MGKRHKETALTSKPIGELLPQLVSEIGKNVGKGAQELWQIWPELVAKVAGRGSFGMSEVLSFSSGILTVAVRNSTLYALLVRQERMRLLQMLRATLPELTIQNIVFRMR